MGTILLLNAPAARHAERLRRLLTTEWTVETAREDDLPEARSDALRRADVLVSARFDGHLPVGPSLRLIQSHAAGFDRVDLAAIPPGCAFCNVYEHESAVAEYVVAAMLEWRIGLRRLDAGLRQGDWRGGVTMPGHMHRELRGATLGIVGFGRIGREVARLATAFGMRVLATTRSGAGADETPPPHAEVLAAGEPRSTHRRPASLEAPPRGAPQDEEVGGVGRYPMDRLDDLLTASDFVLLACALNEETRGLIDEARLRRMRPDGVLINVARGAVVDEAALYEALRERRIGGAVVDTWYRYPSAADPSPLPSELPFHTLDNLVMTPHASSWTGEIVARRWAFIAQNIDRLARGEPLRNVVRAAGLSPA